MIRKYLWAIRARHLYLFIAVLGLFSINFISACDTGSGSAPTATGSVSFQIEWPEDADDKVEASQWEVQDSGSEASETVLSGVSITVSDDCQSRGIALVRVKVTDATGTFSVSEQFECERGVGKIKIPVGTSRRFVISGLDGDGTERYHGEKQDITIHAGSNDIGVIQMERNSEFCTDADGDGYYAERDCGTAIDCNDRNADIYPGALEICGDGRDQDCDGKDTACQPVPADVDDDGDGYSENQGDCNDRNANIFPGAVEICDSLDNDCDGLIDCDDPDCDAVCNPCTDADGDGFFAEANCGTQIDCDDNDASVHPGASEICDDGKDNDCDGDSDEGCNDDNCPSGGDIVGTWQSLGFPGNDTGQFVFYSDGTAASTFYERETSISTGTYTYSGGTLVLNCLSSNNENLEGTTETYNNVTVSCTELTFPGKGVFFWAGD